MYEQGRNGKPAVSEYVRPFYGTYCASHICVKDLVTAFYEGFGGASGFRGVARRLWPSGGTVQLFFRPTDAWEESGVRRVALWLRQGFDARLSRGLTLARFRYFATFPSGGGVRPPPLAFGN